MEILELKNMQLEELSHDEIQSTNGGWWQLIVAAILIDALLNPDDAIDSIIEGYNAARSLAE